QMTAHEAIKRSNKRARTGVISTGGWAVYDVADVPILWAFAALWTRYLNTVPDAGPAQVPSSLLFFEFSGSCVNAVQLHVYDADVLVRRGVHGLLQITADLGGVLIGLRGPALGAEPGDLGGLQRGMCTAGWNCLRRPPRCAGWALLASAPGSGRARCGAGASPTRASPWHAGLAGCGLAWRQAWPAHLPCWASGWPRPGRGAAGTRSGRWCCAVRR